MRNKYYILAGSLYRHNKTSRSIDCFVINYGWRFTCLDFYLTGFISIKRDVARKNYPHAFKSKKKRKSVNQN